MKQVLLDTHVWIWLSIADHKSLSDPARKAIEWEERVSEILKAAGMLPRPKVS